MFEVEIAEVSVKDIFILKYMWICWLDHSNK